MITLKVADLEQQNVSLKKDSEITFQNKVYKKQKVLSKREEDKIPQIAQEYSLDNLECILVEHKLFFSFWVEKVNEKKFTDKSAEEKPVKKIIKQYRGISYEVEVPVEDEQNSSVAKEKRKYRGKYY